MCRAGSSHKKRQKSHMMSLSWRVRPLHLPRPPLFRNRAPHPLQAIALRDLTLSPTLSRPILHFIITNQTSITMDKLKKLFKHDKDEPAQSSQSTTPSSTSTQQRSAAPSSTSSAPPPQSSTQSSMPAAAAASNNAATTDKPAGVLLETNYGNITIALYSDKTPRVSLCLSI